MKVCGFFVADERHIPSALARKGIQAGTTIMVAASPMIVSQTAMALNKQAMIMGAFQPIVSLLQGLAYPITFMSLSGGALMITLGQRSKGLDMMKWGAIGYLTVQFVPSLMKIVMEVGDAMQKSSVAMK